ncbi:MFS transporter [Mucilaginibacter flavidus]|uniref:MFS transporter n=1 Tax=Mucilaginibacter flavidus TaxID=2949309 RepID=UPI00209397CC|nr:MFS transporter [Mucilaginibacter flavidus]MCO5947549.1 MFS transporter [Mucilaginibacter flavidus]
MTDVNPAKAQRNVIFLVIVASLGYFVDIYDLLIFLIVRKKSLLDIGVKPGDVLSVGTNIINWQMFGLLLGGILWGVLGDKLGRLKVLFGSIALYSIANFANGFVHDPTLYAAIRFIAGVGLAGELGAGVTLVSETLSKEKRGYGTMVVAAVGLFGAVAANWISKYDWHTAYFVGGGLGFLLLLLRVGTFESGMFKGIEDKSGISKGNFFMLFSSWGVFKKYLCCILIGAPLWYVIGVLISLQPEFGVALHATEKLNAGDGIQYAYIAIALGGVVAGLLSQAAKSRKLVMLIFLLLSAVSVVVYLNADGLSSKKFLWLCFFMGFAVGYWTLFITIAAEQFGTNIRSTVATTVPNFVRGSLILINMAFLALKGHYGMINSGYIMMAILTILALVALSQLKETFNKDLNYLEIS